jgi:tetratricopeptide (TPR) repeat protein
MPKRLRTQRVEEESRRAFAGALEERFLFRDDVPDNGIDGSVEEFDSADDKGTGLRWFVQLKATDAKEPGDALRSQIPLEHADYYNSLSLPLLMVRYLAAREELYVRWWHDPLPSTREGRADAASVTFRWSEDDLFETADSTRLADEARGFIELRSTDLPLPLFVELSVQELAAGLGGADLELSVRAAAEERPDVVEVRRDGTGGRIVVAAGRLAVELAGVQVASLGFDTAYETTASDQLGVDAMTLLATGFARWGQHEVAARLTQTFFARSRLRGDPEAALLLSGSMTRARRLTEALAVAGEIDELAAGPEDNTSTIFTLTPRRHGSLSDAEKDEYVQTMRARIERRLDAGEEIAASREALSLGNFFRNEHRGDEALALYRQAAELDPEYEERLHYWHEIAGVLFFSGRWEESAAAYARALELGGDVWSAILQADALMFAGHYTEARELFAETLTEIESVERGGEYRLKVYLLDRLVGEHGLGSQTRDIAAARELIDSTFGGGADPDPQTAVAACQAAIQADGLNAFAWWNLAATAEKNEDWGDAGVLFICTALCRPADPEPWAFAVIHLLYAGELEPIPAVLMSGERLTARRLLPTINRLIADAATPEHRSAMIFHLGRIVEGLRDPRGDGVLIRFVQSGGPTTEFGMPGARTRPEPEA